MFCYASSYTSGFGKYIEKWIKEFYPDCSIVFNFDGLIVYKTKQKNTTVPFFNNTYLVLGYSKCAGRSFSGDVVSFLNGTNFNLSGIAVGEKFNKNYKTFKVLPFDKNQPTQIDYKLIKPLEKRIERETGLELAERKHDIDIILSRRSENVMLLMVKRTYQRLTEKEIEKGSLRPEVAHILCKLADLQKEDVCMDMFCGSGAIARQIIKHFPYNMIFASDIEEEKITKLKKEYKNNNKKLYIKKMDALNLDHFKDGFINKIITDPPWNMFNSSGKDFTSFYVKMLQEFARLLKIDGRAVVLMGNITEFETALSMTANFCKEDVINVLINGKKANIYILRRV